MKKYLLQIEFRYKVAPTGEANYDQKFEKIAIGVFDEIEKAQERGNKLLENLESKFPLHTFPDGSKARKSRFGEICGYSPLRLVSNLAYLKTPFQFFAQIKTLDYLDIDNKIDEVGREIEHFKSLKNKNE